MRKLLYKNNYYSKSFPEVIDKIIYKERKIYKKVVLHTIIKISPEAC